MKNFILISCVSKKLPYKAAAKDLYVSPLFRLNLRFAHSLNPDGIFILSAKYGLIGLDEEVETYDLALNNMSSGKRKEWADKVLQQLANRADLKNDHFIFLAGEKYRQHLIPHLDSYEIPMEGLPIGCQLQFLTNAV